MQQNNVFSLEGLCNIFVAFTVLKDCLKCNIVLTLEEQSINEASSLDFKNFL